MIQLQQPALALHAWDTKGFRFRMSTTWDMPRRARPTDVLYWILYALDHTPEKKLPNVVIDCHGDSGKLFVGGEDAWSIHDSLNIFNVGVFNQLKGKKVGTIWLHSCWVAWPPEGMTFCEALAEEAGCNIVASQYAQHTAGAAPGKKIFSYPYGCIDDFEGPTYCWNGKGKKYQIGQNGAGAPGVV